jgi:LacI family transcriptional regulator
LWMERSAAKWITNKQGLSAWSGKSGKYYIRSSHQHQFFDLLYEGLKKNYIQTSNVIICQTHEDENREIENINTLDAQVDGIIIPITNEPKMKNYSSRFDKMFH